MRKSLPIILAGCILLFGCALLLYPSFSQWLSSGKQSQVVADYESAVDDWGEEVARRELERARKYNEDLTEAVALSDPFAEQDAEASTDYDTLLNFTAEGVMGYVEIPKIEVLLPIYHGVSSDILAKGVGHLPETSLPVGGASTHCVLAAHSGMSSARLFTDLPKLEQGDVFYIHVYNQTLTYIIDQIKTVLPSDTSDLTIVPGEDYVTLLTCVPIAVNSHRLLVRGVRTN